MIYINPYLLLGFNNNFESISELEIKKAKRRIFSEIELSDEQSYNYQGLHLNKGDVVKIIEELEYPVKKIFHLQLTNDKKLLNFLSNGNIEFFTNYVGQKTYANKNFIEFISPYFSYQYDFIFKAALLKKEINILRPLLSVSPLVTKNYYEKCFENTYKNVEQIKDDLSKVADEIKIKKEDYINKSVKIKKGILDKIDCHILNLLPEYFQDLNTKIAAQLNRLSVVVNDELSDYELALYISELAIKLKSDSSINELIVQNILVYKRNLEFQKVPLENILKELRDINSRIRQFGKNSIDMLKFQNYVKEILNETNVKSLLNPNLYNLRKGIINQLVIAVDSTPYYYKIKLYKEILNSNILDDRTETEILNEIQKEKRKHKIRIYTVYAAIISFIVFLFVLPSKGNNNISNKPTANNDINYSNQSNDNYYENQNRQSPNLEPAESKTSLQKKDLNDNDHISVLFEIIQNEKSKLKQMEQDIRKIDDKLDILKYDINNLKQKLKNFDIAISQGKDVDETLYNSIVDKHNELTKTYNKLILERNSSYTEYQNLIDKINKNVKDYNNQIN